MRYSALMLWLKYVNREPRIAVLFAGLLFGGILLTPSIVVLMHQAPFILDGETVRGTAVSKQIARMSNGSSTAAIRILAHGGKRGPKHVINYEFTDAAGDRHTGRGAISIAEWNAVQPGDAVLVRYVRSNPARNQLERDVWDFWPAIPFAVIGLTILAGATYFASGGLRWIDQQVRLVRTGDAIAGRFTRAEVEYRGKRQREAVSVLEYESTSPPGLRGKLEMRGKLRSNWRTDGRLLILVDPIDPTIHAPDIFGARADDWERLQLDSWEAEG